MNDTAVVTLIVVSAALTIFLILFSLVLLNIVLVLRQVRRVMGRAENAAASVEAAAEAFEKSATPLAALKIIGRIVENATKFKNRRDQKDGQLRLGTGNSRPHSDSNL